MSVPVWKLCPFNERYEISDHGYVRNFKTKHVLRMYLVKGYFRLTLCCKRSRNDSSSTFRRETCFFGAAAAISFPFAFFFICSIQPYQDLLLLSTLNYLYEIREPSNVEELAVAVSPRLSKSELKLAEQLVKNLRVKYLIWAILKICLHNS